MCRQTTQGFDHLPKIVRLGDKDGGGIKDAACPVDENATIFDVAQTLDELIRRLDRDR